MFENDAPISEVHFSFLVDLYVEHQYNQLQLINRLIYTTEVSVGGYIVIMDMEHNNKTERHPYIGTTKTRSYIYQWDTVKPYHCIADKKPSSSCPQYLNVQDLTEIVSIPHT